MVRTLYFSRPCNLKLVQGQLVYRFRDDDSEGSAPIEDLGFVVLDHAEISLTMGLVSGLLEQNVVVVPCDRAHYPAGILLPIEGHHIQQVRFKSQVEAGAALKKRLWKEVIRAKINNQADLLRFIGQEDAPLLRWSKTIRSGDPDNLEARASAYYWPLVFASQVQGFRRDRFGLPPNNLLNYGYAVLRAATARALTGSGLLPTLGLFHHNKYNAFALADDLMEPYRPFVDRLVLEMLTDGCSLNELNKEVKGRLLGVLTLPTRLEGENSPLLTALSRSASSLVKCLDSDSGHFILPRLHAS